MKETQKPPAHAANLSANSGNTAYGIWSFTSWIPLSVFSVYSGDAEIVIATRMHIDRVVIFVISRYGFTRQGQMSVSDNSLAIT